MKHWDLKPGEDVSLSAQSGEQIHGYFEFRDTIRACFTIEDQQGNLRFRQMYLDPDGGLREFVQLSGRHGHWKRWTIDGLDRESRVVCDQRGLSTVRRREVLTRRASACGGEA